MISQLKGKIDFRGDKFAVIDVGGVGYKVFCSEKTFNGFPAIGEEMKIFTYLVVKDDALDLYGFLNFDELHLFERLLDISGVGPRAALNLASFESVGQLKEALGSGRKVVPGIGPKKVQKILLELGEELDKIKNPYGAEPPGYRQKSKIKNSDDEVVDALVSLGVTRARAKEVVAEIPEDIKGTENIIKEALKRMGR